MAGKKKSLLTRKEKQLLEQAAQEIREAHGSPQKIQAALDKLEKGLPKNGKLYLFSEELGKNMESIEDPKEDDSPADMLKKLDGMLAGLERQKKMFTENEIGKLFPQEIIDVQMKMYNDAIAECNSMRSEVFLFATLEKITDILDPENKDRK